MKRELKEKCIAEFSDQIFLPLAYFVKGEDHFRVAYHIHDAYHYINAVTPLEIARVLKRIGKIESFSIVGEHVTMYRKEIRTAIGKRYEPIMYPVLVTANLSEIELTREEALRAAALDYWDQAREKMTTGAKVVNMFTVVVKRIV